MKSKIIKTLTVVSGQTTVNVKQINDDFELVQRCLKGDELAMQKLYNRHSDKLYSMALRMTSRPVDAEDIVQDTFFRAWKSIEHFRGESSFRTWLYKIGVNLCHDLQKRRKRVESETTEVTSPRNLDAIVQKRLEVALEQLPDGCREVLVLHDIMELTHQEIAQILDLNVGTSKSQLHKARVRMRKLLATSLRPAPDNGLLKKDC